MISAASLLVLHLAATAFMTGVIWFVQLIQYPWFHDCPKDRFVAYHARYAARIGLIVGPAMMVEAATGVLLLGFVEGTLRLWTGISLAVLLINWLSTAFLQVPCHHRLSKGYDEAVHRRLVKSNWIRTIGWTIRTVVIGYVLLRFVR